MNDIYYKDNKNLELSDFEMILQMWDKIRSDFELDCFVNNTIWNSFQKQYKYIYRTEKTCWIDGKYQHVNDNYIKLIFHNGNNRINGDKRIPYLRKRVYLRRLMKNDITIEEMVVNVIYDIIQGFYFYDGELESKTIMKLVNEVLNMSVEEIEAKYGVEIEKAKKISKPKGGIIYKKIEYYYKRGDYKRKVLDDFYKEDLSVNVNMSIINKMFDIDLKHAFVYSYLEKKGIRPKKDKVSEEQLMNMIDLNLSANKNIEIIRNMGYKFDDKTIKRLVRENKNKVG